MTADRKKRVIAVASGGGHWEQLMLLRPAFSDFEAFYVTTHRTLAERDHIENAYVIPDTNRHSKRAAIACLWKAYRLIGRVKPDVVVTTGALPGLLVLIAARAKGVKTVWIDSVANSERLSMSGRWARSVATLSLTQWEHLAQDDGPFYHGNLL